MNRSEKTFLLNLAKRSINNYLENGQYLKANEDDLPSKNLLERQGTFVTLTINGQLKGCIGCLEPVKPIYQSIIENAVSASFFDPRFYPLQKEELSKIEIEISLLSVPKKLKYETPQNLVKILEKEKPGVIIKKGLNRATFLPQVWEELTTTKDFLSQLCLKAGLSPLGWTSNGIEILTYTAEVFHE